MRGKKLLGFVIAVWLVVPAMGHAGPLPSDAGRGAMTGTVTNEAGAALEGICVWTWSPSTGASFEARTDAQGSYAIRSMPESRYEVSFADCEGSTYMTQWFDHKDSSDEADLVAVVAGETRANVDAALKTGGSIGGTVTNQDGEPIASCVTAYQSGSPWGQGSAYTDDAGHYRVNRLYAGDYRLRFGPCDYVVIDEPVPVGMSSVPANSPNGYVTRWYSDRTSEWSSDPVHVDEGAAVTGIDQALPFAGAIEGRVTDAQGNGINGICVDVYGEDTYKYGYTDGSGVYRVTELDTGTYNVYFYDCSSRVWGTATYPAEVNVTRPHATSGIDAVLEKRPRPDLTVASMKIAPATIQTDDLVVGHNPFVRNVTVDVANTGTGDGSDGGPGRVTVWARTDSDGRIQLIGSDDVDLAPGSSHTYSFKWNGAGTVGDATVYALTCHYDDAEWRNNEMKSASFVGVGGTGVGMRALNEKASRPYCDEFDPWDF